MPDRETQIAFLVDHFQRPRHKGTLEGADATMPGGNPGCGDLVTMHVKADAEGRVEAVRFEGEGCTISQAAASILADRVNKTHPTLDEVAEFPYETMLDMLGRDVYSRVLYGARGRRAHRASARSSTTSSVGTS